MFYSHILLARKGSLGTVWYAAHLQNRLNKSEYTATNIPQTVDDIMFPKAPMALRMSAHLLLLGVVRIYSKKVEDLLRDWNLLNTWLAKCFVSPPQVDLPENARQAPLELVTLPQSLNLEDFHLEDDTLDCEFDYHIRSMEDITLTDQIPTGIDPYVAIRFDEKLVIEGKFCMSFLQDIFQESSPMDIDQCTVPATGSGHPGETDVEMDYEAGRNDELDIGTYGPRNDTEDTRPNNFTEALNPNTERCKVNSPGSVPEIEKRRDAAHSLSPASHSPFSAQQQNVRVEHTESLDETLNGTEANTPSIDEEMLNSRGNSPFELRSGYPGFAGSEQEHADFVHHPSPQLALHPTPPLTPQTRPRKRKFGQDHEKRLEDPSDTLRKRKKMPLSKVDIWRLNNQSRKYQIVNEPLFTGFSDVLRSVFEKDCVASKPYLAVTDENFPEPASVSSPTREAETEINLTSLILKSTVPDSTNLGSTVQLSQGQQNEKVQDFAGPQSTHADSGAIEAQSPQTFNNDDIGIEHFRDGGYPEYMSSPPSRSSPPITNTEPSTSTNSEDLSEMTDEDLSFLEVGSNTPVRSPASQDPNALTGRTRALAQYLKERSSSSPTSRCPSEDLSLNKILAGKTRKLDARMFSEILVLKSRELIDVQHNQPYRDIALKLPALFQRFNYDE